MKLRGSDWQSQSEMDSIRNACDVWIQHSEADFRFQLLENTICFFSFDLYFKLKRFFWYRKIWDRFFLQTNFWDQGFDLETKIFETETETFTDSYRKEMEKSWYRGVSRRVVNFWESYVFFYLQKSVQTAIFALYSLDLGLYWWCQQLVLGMIKTACIEWTPLHDKKK